MRSVGLERSCVSKCVFFFIVLPGLWNTNADANQGTWRIDARDCSIQGLKTAVERSTETREPMFRSECFVGNGTYLHFGAEIKPALIIDELILSVRIKSNQPGPQLMARVILPRDIDPKTKAPFSFLVGGDTYRDSHVEQILYLSNIPQQLESQLRVLRIERNQPIDGREAFIDRVIVNAFGVPGDTKVWLGVPQAIGVAQPTDEGAVREMGIQRLDDLSKTISVRVDGDVIRVGEEPIFVRAIDDRGEDWRELKRLGINTIRLSRGPTTDDFGKAEALGMYLIAPIPSETEWQHLRHYSHSIIAWELSKEGNRMELPNGQGLVAGAPSYLSAMHSKSQWSRPILGHDPVVGGGFRPNILLKPGLSPRLINVSESGTSQAQSQESAAYWQSIFTEPTATILKQLRQLGYRGPDVSLDPDEIEEQVIAAIQAGSRGLCLSSETLVLSGNAVETARSLAIQCVLEKLEFAEPWLVAGQTPVEIPCSSPEGCAVAFAKNQGTLIVYRNRSAQDSCELPSDANRSVRLTLSGCTPDTLAFRVSSAGLEPLTISEGAGGIQVEVKNPGQTEFILATHDANLVILAARQCAENGLDNLQRELSLTTLVVEETARVVRSFPAITGVARDCGLQLETVYGDLGRCRHALHKRKWFDAENSLRCARRSVYRIRQKLRQAVVGSEPEAAGNPLLNYVATMTTAWQLLPQWRRSPWQPISAGSNDFDGVESILNMGWRAYDTRLPGRSSRVTIKRGSQGSANGCLALTATREESGTRFLSQAAFRCNKNQMPGAWIQSAIMEVPSDHIVRITGQVLVADSQDDEPARLVVSDSYGDSDLAISVPSSTAWQSFVIYRGADGRLPFRLTIALAGTGEALIDKIATSMSPRVTSEPRLPVQAVSQRK